MSAAIEKKISEWLDSILIEEPTLFLVDVKVKPSNNINVFIDGDNGLSIDLCVRINRKLYKTIEEAAIFKEGDFSLEVSSPGLSEPLKLHRQYIKNIGRGIEILFKDGSVREGTLLTVTDLDILIEHQEGKGKKAVIQKLVIPLENIKATTVQIKF